MRGVLGLEKGNDYGPTAVEWWLSRPKIAKKKKGGGGGGCPLISLYKTINRGLSESLHPIFYIK